MNYRYEDRGLIGYIEFNGEDYKVAMITIDENGTYEFTDVLFAFEYVLTNRDLNALKLDLEHFYRNNDSIGRIENKYIYDD